MYSIELSVFFAVMKVNRRLIVISFKLRNKAWNIKWSHSVNQYLEDMILSWKGIMLHSAAVIWRDSELNGREHVAAHHTAIILVWFQFDELCPSQLIFMKRKHLLFGLLFFWETKQNVTRNALTLPFLLILNCLLFVPHQLLTSLKILRFFCEIKKYLSSFPDLFRSSTWSLFLSDLSYLPSEVLFHNNLFVILVIK